jgi:CheY-like chemotaxis protein/DNA-directed RNA polymerase subunit RPC12/RpoP
MRDDSADSVLLVNDDRSMRELLSKHLEEAGFVARQAEDGIDGLVKLRDALPKVIISDFQMPRMSGIEFVSVVRRRFPFIPVIVLSAAIPTDIPAEANPDVWFQKGALRISELLHTLHDLVRKSPDRAHLPQMVTIPVRVRPGFAGYFMLTCTDCLRTFRATSTPENKSVERSAVCTHCNARVPFIMESAEPD